MVSKLCFMTRNSFDSIFVSAFISLTMTTIYNNYYYIVNAIVGVMNVITSAMIGGIGNSIAAESKRRIITILPCSILYTCGFQVGQRLLFFLFIKILWFCGLVKN